MQEETEFVLSEEELELISELLDDQYSFDAIALVHQGILVAPRLIAMGVFPGVKDAGLLGSDFYLSSFHVISAMRMIGLSKFGIMYFHLVRHYKLHCWEDVGLVIAAIQHHYDVSEKNSSALWIASLVDLKQCTDSFLMTLLYSQRR